MSTRVWTASLMTALLIVAIVTYARGHTASATLLSQHSMPAVHLPRQQVAITAEGKLFHDPSCRYIHGKPEMMSAQEAARQGYTPCPRCLRSALHP